MIRRIYVVLGFIAAPFAIKALQLYTKITSSPRVRVLVTNEDGEVLLLRGILSDGKWTLPGGGIKRHETPAVAAWRELREETGINVPKDSLKFVRTLTRADTQVSFTALLYQLSVKRTALPDGLINPLEIRDVAWFDRDKLPAPLSSIAQAALH
jgi:ADP-ribose pyrophosphatase YjhB (NUDIX family)